IEGFAEKSAQQLVDAIQSTKDRPLSTLLFALGVPQVGDQVAKLLARQFPAMDKLSSAGAEALSEVRGVGDSIAKSVTDYFARPRVKKLIARLEEAGVNLTEPVTKSAGSGKLAGQTYVLTGTLPNLSRQQATQLLEDAGAKVADSVAKTTTTLVAG